MTVAPYSDEWRSHTLERMRAADVTMAKLVAEAGFAPGMVGEALGGTGVVTLEVAGPIDELLDRFEQASEAARIAAGVGRIYAQHGGEHIRVQRVAVDIDALDGLRVCKGTS